MEGSLFFIVLVAAFLHATWNYFAKGLARRPGVAMAGSSLLFGLCLFPFIISDLGSELPWRIILISGAVHSVYFTLLGMAYESGEISVVYPVSRGVGVMGTALISALFLSEQFSQSGLVGMGAVSFGTLLMGVTRLRNKSLPMVLLSILIGGFIATYSIIDQIGVSHVAPLTYLSLISIIQGVVVLGYLALRIDGSIIGYIREDIKPIFWIGLFSGMTYTVILYAFQQTSAAYVVAVRESSVIFAFLYGYFALKEKVNLRKIIAILAILIGVIAIRL